MASWLESKAPRLYSDLLCPQEICDYLQHVTTTSEPPHLLISGPSGCGKTAIHRLVCRQVLGPSWKSTSHVLQARNIVRKEGAMANFEAFLRPAGSQSGDTLASRTSLDSFQLLEYEESASSPPPAGAELEIGDHRPISRILIIEDADFLTRGMQAYLRRMMEKTSINARFIFTATTPSRVIDALRSRTYHIRLPPLTSHQIEQRLEEITSQEKCQVTKGILGDIAHVSNGNLRKAIFLTDALRHHGHLDDRKKVQLVASNIVSREIQLMVEEAMRSRIAEWKWERKDNKNTLEFKGAMSMLDKIMAKHYLSAEDVVEHIHSFLVRGRTHFDIDTMDVLMNAIAQCDVSLRRGSKGRIHLESLFFTIAETVGQPS
ncbi:MAG: hypothetical protein VW230_06605 [Candidatus Poseidoniales archaeon]